VNSIDDLDLSSGQRYPVPRPPRPSWVGPIASLLVFIALISGFWWYRAHRAPAPESVRRTEPVPAGRAPHIATEAPAEPSTLPPLDQLDPTIRTTIGSLTQMSAASAWLATDNLAEQFTAIVQGVADGNAPMRMLARFRPVSPLQVTERGGRTVIDPRSYSRYDSVADAVTSLDPAASVRAYRTLAPRLNEAYAQLGIPDSTLDAALENAIVRLVKTPVPAGDIAVVPRGAGYAFASPELEALSPAQKLLIRTGPVNARRIQARLREIGLALGIPSSRL
jgi:hypothetical protein